MDLTEDLLYYVWRSGMLNAQSLCTATGESLKILHPGFQNGHSGPDFEQARLLIGETQWAGQVEMHLKSSDWYRHQHQEDQAYENVILHVVFEHDESVFRQDGTEIPALELKTLIPEKLLFSYRDLIAAQGWISCAASIRSVDEVYVAAWLNRVLLERLEQRSRELLLLVETLKGSWDEAFYITLARNFGFKVNADAFETLARTLPQTLLARCKNDPLKIEALVFGQAGWLQNNPKDDYPQSLKREYQFLKQKHALIELEASRWKFMRLRPANFPTLRLAQFSALVLKSSHLFSRIMEIENIPELRGLFSGLPANSYWETHYLFDKQTDSHAVQMGQESVNNLLLNTMAVFLFAYGWQHQQADLQRRALQLLETLPPEHNQVIRKFAELGIKVKDAAGSQALLELKKSFCDVKKCLSCGIGNKILNPGSHDPAHPHLF